jgi:hypothetical protein
LYQSEKFRVARKLNQLYISKGLNPTFLSVTKFILLIVGFIVFYYLKNTGAVGIGATDAHTCLYDRSIEFYSDANYVMRSSDNTWIKNGLMILSSELIDLIFLSICVIW